MVTLDMRPHRVLAVAVGAAIWTWFITYLIIFLTTGWRPTL